jgi:hypothetical protein
MSAFVMPEGDQWKDPRFLIEWKRTRREKIEKTWRREFNPLLIGVPLSSLPKAEVSSDEAIARQLIQFENESLIDRCHRLEGKEKKPKSNRGATYQVPMVLAFDRGQWLIHPCLKRATPDKLLKAKRMYEFGLEKKAQRELACGILGGEVHCKNGHSFLAPYECGNRYCTKCGPRGAQRMFARHLDKIRFAATRLMLCDKEECPECSLAIEEKRLPHWPPPRGLRPKMVCAKIDFTLKHDGTRPAPELMRKLNGFIKKFFRTLEKRYGLSRKDYGVAYCDELGGNNSNPHAHGIYVGPWLPQKNKELSAIWRETTGDSFIISIKYAEDLPRALHHAVKYPAKFAERSSPERLADLEIIFHRVRRFHCLAAFYAIESPEEDIVTTRKCPECGERLSQPSRWQTIEALLQKGLRDFEIVGIELAKARALVPP